jgi:TfoX/Sxy family transcriptional regulator of competence genes
MAFDEDVAKRVRDVLSKECTVTERRMFGGLAFMVRGHMCCGIIGEDLVVRVGPGQHQQALAESHARAMDFTGRPMRGFIYVSPLGYRSKANLRNWIRRGLRFVSSLPAR